MCGFVGVFSRRGAPTPRSRVEAALRRVAHRGPDGTGYFQDGRCALAHARLAIVDRANGAQPLTDPDRRLALVVNGEIYGHAAERERLERLGHRFRTRSDSEVALALYVERGDAMPASLRGELALALWDGARERLLCARDRFGIRPLYYTEHEGAVFVASGVRALFALGAPAAWDEDALHQILSMQYARPGETPYRGVRALRPGHRLVVDRDGIVEEPYDVALFPREHRPIDEIDAVARLRDLLSGAVSERLRAEVPVAVQLSGGIDSSAVAALVARERRPTCFTVSFTSDDGASDADELPFAARVVSHLGADHEVVEVGPRDVADHLGDALERAEGPTIDAHLVAKWKLAARARELGYLVLLTGEGADELLAGYAHLRADHAMMAPGGASTAEDRALLGMHLPTGAELPTAAVAARLGRVPTWMRAKASLGRRVRDLLAPSWTAARVADPFERAIAAVDVEGTLAGRGSVEQAQALWTAFSLGGYILPVVGDGAEMAHAVEGRLPFLDPIVWREVSSWPSALRTCGAKHTLREAMRGLLPEEIRLRPKHPFLGPPMFARRDRAPQIDALLWDTLDRAARSLPFLDASSLARLRRALDMRTGIELRALEPAISLVLSLALLDERVLRGGDS
jgi:asparagine synthase (glutamine-hydrolysing)